MSPGTAPGHGGGTANVCRGVSSLVSHASLDGFPCTCVATLTKAFRLGTACFSFSDAYRSRTGLCRPIADTRETGPTHLSPIVVPALCPELSGLFHADGLSFVRNIRFRESQQPQQRRCFGQKNNFIAKWRSDIRALLMFHTAVFAWDHC